MPRPLDTDFYQSFRFGVSVSPAPGGLNYLEANAGFNNITTPEVSSEVAEYREGTYIWTRKQMGVPSVSDATFQQGISSISVGGNGHPFMDWIFAALLGAEYRVDLTIRHFHRKDHNDSIVPNAAASRELTLKQAFPIRVKPEADFDATSSEISIREMDVACEAVTIRADVPGSA